MLSKDFDFEKSIKELEEISNMLEDEQISLEKSISLFEKGIRLSKDCSTYLDNAKQKIVLLTELQEESVDND